MLKWLNHSDVKSALNVPSGASFFLTDNGVGFNYELTEKNLMPFYRDVAENTNLRVLVYNGDTDPGINSFVSQNWTVALGLDVKDKWRPWTLDGKTRMGGYVTSYEGDFQFLTIRGSGHMVPEFKPAAAFEFMRDWIQGEPFKPYKT
jgi:serine carboxypeptidase-like clade I